MAISKIDPAGLDIGQIGGRRNLIINGAYTIWQRATTSSSNGVNTADRWQQNDATFTQETSIVPDNFQYSMKVVANGSGTPLLLQKIERPQVCGHVLNQDITVSFYARSSNVNAITKLELNDEGGSGGRPDGGAQTLSAADTWERITHTFTAPFSSLTGNSVAVILTFATSATVYISGFQVEVGSVATPFEHRSYGEELALCERYYQSWGGANAYEYLPLFGGAVSGTRIEGVMQYKRDMRTTPDISYSGNWQWLDGVTTFTFGNILKDSIALNSVRISDNGISGLTQYRFYLARANNDSTARFKMDAEL
jgi:hypothetical protein